MFDFGVMFTVSGTRQSAARVARCGKPFEPNDDLLVCVELIVDTEPPFRQHVLKPVQAFPPTITGPADASPDHQRGNAEKPSFL
jgi:hypothetical protein